MDRHFGLVITSGDAHTSLGRLGVLTCRLGRYGHPGRKRRRRFKSWGGCEVLGNDGGDRQGWTDVNEIEANIEGAAVEG